MAAFDPRRFGEVLRLPGAAAFSSAGFLTRIPLSGATLAITLAVVHQTGSYATAGLLVGLFAISRAASAPILSRVVDRYGQFAVMLLATMYQLSLLAVLTAGIFLDWHLAVLGTIAAFAGLGTGSPPAFVRARWAGVARSPQQLSTAFAWESLVESTAFTLAPLVIVLLVGSMSPLAGMVFVVAMVGISGTALYLQRGTQPPVVREPDGGRQKVGRRATAIVVVCAAYYFSASFAMGALDIIAVAQGEVVTIVGFTGIVLAVGSIGKMIGAIVYGSLQWRHTPQQRMLVIAPLFALAALLVPVIGGSSLLIVAAFVIGPIYSAALTSANLVVQSSVPKGRLTELLAWMFAAFGVGVAAGNYFAGLAVEYGGFTAAAWVYAGSGALLVLTLAIDLLFLRRRASGDDAAA